MYTLKVDILNNETDRDILHALQAMAQEAPTGTSYTFDLVRYFTNVTIQTVDIKTIKRVIDIIESDRFMREDFKEYLGSKYD